MGSGRNDTTGPRRWRWPSLRCAGARSSTSVWSVSEDRQRYTEIEEATARAASGEPTSEDPLIAKLPNIGLRTLVCAALFMVLVVANAVISDVAWQKAADEAAAGVRVESTVVKIEPSPSRKDSEKLYLSYPVGTGTHTILAGQKKGAGYEVGDKITVIHAPGDPKKVLGVGVNVRARGIVELDFPLIVLSVLGFAACLFTFAFWRLRYRSVLRTGWRPAMATVRPGWLTPDIDVYFEDDYKLVRTRKSLRTAPRFKGLGKVPVLVGGEGNEMVVVFPHGRWLENRLYAVPVKEIVPDSD